MTYDQWKTRDPNEPYGDDYDAERECDHDEYDIDILTGRAECNMCPHSWYASNAEIESERRREEVYWGDMEREERRQRWREIRRRLTLPIRWPLFRMMQRIWPRKSLSVLHDDEVPF